MLFSPYGQVLDTRILVDPSTNQSRGCGFVRYGNQDEADRAMEALNGTTLAGCSKPLMVKVADSTKNKILGGRTAVTPGAMVRRPPPTPAALTPRVAGRLRDADGRRHDAVVGAALQSLRRRRSPADGAARRGRR